MCNRNLVAKKSFSPSSFSPFGCSLSLQGPQLQDIDLAIILKRQEDGNNLTAAEKAALYDKTHLVATTATQLTKCLHVWAGSVECYIDDDALLSMYNRDWHSFTKENKDNIADISVLNPGLPARI